MVKRTQPYYRYGDVLSSIPRPRPCAYCRGPLGYDNAGMCCGCGAPMQDTGTRDLAAFYKGYAALLERTADMRLAGLMQWSDDNHRQPPATRISR